MLEVMAQKGCLVDRPLLWAWSGVYRYLRDIPGKSAEDHNWPSL